MYQAVIFDLDGTLADTLADIANALNHVLGRFGLPGHPVPAYRAFVGDGVRMLIERALPDDQKDRVDEILPIYLPYLVEHGADTATLYPGIAELLDALTERRMPIAVCSNKPHASTLDVVAKLMDRWTFGAVQGHTEPFEKKPAADMPWAVARRLGVEPGRCMFVGDSNVDIQTAKNAGMAGVGVAWGFRGAEEVAAAGAKHIIEHPMELIDLL